MSNSPATTLSAIGVTPTRPSTDVPRAPVKPGVTSNVCEPLALASACTSGGALTATGCSAIVLRTWCVPSLQTSDPATQSPNGASVRVKVTVKLADSPGARWSVDGLTETSKP